MGGEAALSGVMGLVLALPAVGELQDAQRLALRNAISDLSATFGADYPNGAGFLQRLEALDPADDAAFEALRREALLANPLLVRQPLLFVTRRKFAPDHHNTETFFQQGEINTDSCRPSGALNMLDLAGGRVTVLLDAGCDGLIRDPEISFDGKRVVFSCRRNRSEGASI